MSDWQSNGGKIQKKMIQGEDHQHPQNVRPMKTNLTPKFQQAFIFVHLFIIFYKKEKPVTNNLLRSKYYMLDVILETGGPGIANSWILWVQSFLPNH